MFTEHFLAHFNKWCHDFVAGQFNKLVYDFPIRIPERFSLVIRSLLTQEGICFTLKPDFKFLEVKSFYSFHFFFFFSNLGLADYVNLEAADT